MSDVEDLAGIEAKAKNQIHFTVDNQTNFNLVPQDSFADWGDFAEPPCEVAPHSSGSGGHIISSHAPYTGSAGMVGYKIEDKEDLYIRLLGSNPYLSVTPNYAAAAVLHTDSSINQENYNWVYYESADQMQYQKPFQGKTLSVTCQIDEDDETTATFQVTWQ